MSFLDPWRSQGRQLVAALQPGERVLAFTATDVQATLPPTIVDAVPTPPAERAPESRWWLLGGVVALIDWSPSLPFLDRFVDRLSSVPARGPMRSDGIRLFEALRTAPWGRTRYLAVTEGRLVVFDARGSLDAPLRLIAEVPRRTVVGAEVRTRLLPPSPGRLRVHFDDGSWLELADGFQMGRRRAKQVRDALLHDTVSVDGEPGPPNTAGARPRTD